MPIDLVPDFLPVIGYADDAIIVAIGLRSVVRAAGPEVITAHWPGTDTGLTVLHRLAGLPAPETRAGRSERERAQGQQGRDVHRRGPCCVDGSRDHDSSVR